MAKITSNLERALTLVKAYENGDVKTLDKYTANTFVNRRGKKSQNKNSIIKMIETKVETMIKNRLPQKDTIEVVRKFEENDLVVLHLHLKSAYKKNYVLFAILRFANEKLDKSWTGMAEEVVKTASGHSQIDGETKISDIDQTEKNKKIVHDFIVEVLFKGETKKAAKYLSDKSYIEHNPHAKDGLNEMIKAFAELESQGKKIIYKKIDHLVGKGNFVFAMTEGLMGSAPYKYFDLFRLESGKIVEHWDVMEPIMVPIS